MSSDPIFAAPVFLHPSGVHQTVGHRLAATELVQEFHVHPCSSLAKCLRTKGLASPPSLVILLPTLRSVGGEAHATLYSIRTVICSVVVSSGRAFSERIPKRKRCFVGGLSRRSRRPLRAPAPPKTSPPSPAQSQLRLLPARIATLAESPPPSRGWAGPRARPSLPHATGCDHAPHSVAFSLRSHLQPHLN
jgi:hypothetical protein